MKLRLLVAGVLLQILAFNAYGQSGIGFTSSVLDHIDLSYPTSLAFGPDNKLYVTQQDGTILGLTVQKNGPNDYEVTNTDVILLVKNVPNHDDRGNLIALGERQITGILPAGTSANPILYICHSDPRIGGGGQLGDVDLDTNSGTISKLTKNGSTWSMVHLVRGLPRSEENHAPNGLALDAVTNTLYLAQGGNTNAGSPSNCFAFLTEYALSGAVLKIDLNLINSQFGGSYTLPTLDDPTRSNSNGADVNDPFGGNDGRNQAKLVIGGPVQIYSPGYRNIFDIVLTKTPGKSGRMYTIDNGANGGWGGYPENEGLPTVTNQRILTEPGSTEPTMNDDKVNNLDNLHHITGPGYYGGHPSPIRANPASAGLYWFDNATNQGNFSQTPTTDWPPVPVSLADPVQSDYRNPGVNDGALYTWPFSTNGLTEYTSSAFFNGAMAGNLLAASWGGAIHRIELNAAGTAVTNVTDIFSGFGQEPLDVIAQGDGQQYAGSIWALTYRVGSVVIFEPNSSPTPCSGDNNNYNRDDDGDGYSNGDETLNGTNPCSAASKPTDFDGDFLSDRYDTNDDNDALNDINDKFALDVNNGLNTALPIDYPFLNGNPGFGLFGVGHTGLMTNLVDDYSSNFDPLNPGLIVGGAVGALSVPAQPGDAVTNNQKYAFQFGIPIAESVATFTLRSRMLGTPFFNGATGGQLGTQSQGIYFGTGDQNNYLKLVLHANSGNPGLQILCEQNGVVVNQQMIPVPGILSVAQLDLFIEVNALTGLVKCRYQRVSDANPVDVGQGFTVSGNLISLLQDNTNAVAVGLIASSGNKNSFSASWDYMKVTTAAVTQGMWQPVTYANGTPQQRHESSFVEVNGKFYLVGGRGISSVNIYDPVTSIWTNGAQPPIELNHFQAIAYQNKIYAICAFTGAYPTETPVSVIYIYDTQNNTWSTGPTIPVSRRRGSAGVVLYYNKFYIVGGIQNGHTNGWVRWVDQFDPVTGIWTQLPDAPRARDHFHAGLISGKIYCAGGRTTSQPNFAGNMIGAVDVYDIGNQTWSTPSQIISPRGGAAVAVVNSELIVAGGEVDYQNNALDIVEAYNPALNTWTVKPPMNIGRHGTQLIPYAGNLYIAAGSTVQGGGGEINTMAFAVYPSGPPANSPPMVAQVYPNQSVPSTQTTLVVPLSQIFVDDNGMANLTFTVQNNTNAALITNTAIVGTQLTFTLSGTAGVGVITLRATDASNAFVQTTFQLTVTPPNTPPTVAQVYPNQIVPSTQTTLVVPLNQIFADDGGVANLTFTVPNNTNAALISNTAIVGTQLTFTLSGTAGIGVITLRATDASNAFVQTTFQLTVTPPNTPPTVAQVYPNQSVLSTQPTLVVPLNQIFADDAGVANLTFTVPNNTNAALISSTAIVGTQLTFTLSGTTGVGVITLRATDASNAFVQTTFQLTVTAPPANTPPTVAQVYPNQSVPSTLTTFVVPLDQIFADDGGVANLTFTVPNNTNAALISNTAIVGTQLTFTLSGTTGVGVITLRATDASNAFVQTTFQLTVTAPPANTPPTVAIVYQNQSVPATQPTLVIPLNVIFADDGGVANLTFTVPNNTNAALISNTAIVGTQLTFTLSGTTGVGVITLRATDASNAFVETTFQLTITANTTPTVAQVYPNQSVPSTQTTLVVPLNQIFADDGGLANLTFTVPNNTNAALISNTAIVGTQLTFTLSGTTGVGVITLRATDASNAFVQTTFQLTVTPPPNTAPTVAQVYPNQSVPSTQTTLVIPLNQIFADDGGIANLTFTVPNNTNAALISNTAIVGTQLTFTLSGTTGVGVITLRATDASNAFVQTTFQLTVTPPPNTAPTVAQVYPNQSVPSTQTTLVVPLNQIFADDGGVANLTFTVPNNTNAALISNTAIVGTQLTFTLSGTTGVGVITLRATDASNAFVQTTFQLTVTTPPAPTLVNVIRINSGGPAQTFGSETWVADQYFTGGTVYAVGSAISNTTQDQIYQTERYGNVQYHIPVTGAGTYAVDLHLAEIYFTTAGSRVFNINVENGQFVRNNLDMIQSYGAGLQAIVLRADNLNVTDGMIDIVLTTVVDNAKISGIAVGKYNTPPVNTAPTVAQVYPNQSVPSTQTTVVVPLNQIFADDGGLANLTFTVPNNTNAALISNTAIVGTQLTFTLSGTTGAGVITLRATDASNAFVQTTFQLTVTAPPANTAPTVAQVYPNQSVPSTQTTLVVPLNQIFADDGGVANLTFTVPNNTNAALISNTAIVGTQLTFTLSGTTGVGVITLRATDASNAFVQTTFQLTVTTPPANTAPTVAQVYPNQSVPSTQTTLVVPLNQIFADDGGVANLTFTVPNNTNAALISNTAIVGTQLTFTLSGTTGVGVITLRATDASNAFIQTTFQLTVTTPPAPTLVNVIRINSGGPAQTFGSETWVADQYFTGGTVYAVGSAISNTTQDQIYQTERYGNVQYHIPVTGAGTYAVDLHLAEIYFTTAGSRVFNINVENGQFVRNNLDMIQSYGAGLQAIVLRADNLNVTDGMIDIVLTTVVDNAKISGIAVGKYNTPPVNTAPTVAQVYPNQSVPSTQTTVVVPLNQIFADDGGVANLTFTVPNNTNAALISNTAIVGTQLTFTLSGTTGAGVITLRATDASNAFVQTTFQLTVTAPPANTAPTVAQVYPNQSVPSTQTTLVVPLNQIFADDGGVANLTFTVPNNTNAALISNTAIVGTQLTFTLSGTTGVGVITLRATDASNALVQTTFQLTVTTPPANTAPTVAQVYPNQSVPSTQTTLVVPLNQIFADDGGVANLTFTVPNNTNAALISNTAIVGTQLTFTLSGTTGVGVITLRATDASNAFVQTTFQLTVTTPPAPTLVNVIRINSGGPAQTFGSETWVADQYFTGGTVYAVGSAISNTTQDQIYQTERYGNVQYHIPVTGAGTYAVDLHLAEIYFTTAGSRVFNINVENGQFVRNNLDMIQSYGAGLQAIVLRADNLNVTDGMIDIVLTTVVDNAKISGIAVGKYTAAGARTAVASSAPVVTRPPDIILNEGQSWDYQVIASDPAGESLTYTSVNLPASLYLDKATGVIKGTIEVNANTFPVILKVTNKSGHSTEANFIVTITDIPHDRESFEPRMILYPNPAEREFSLKMEVKQRDSWHFQLIDVTGKQFDLGSFELAEGVHVLDFDLAPFNVSPGFYFLSVGTKHGKKNIKVALK